MKAIFNRYKKLKKREKLAIVLLVVSLCVGLYYNILYRPMERKIRSYDLQANKTENKLSDIKKRHPELYKKQAKVKELREKCDDLKNEINRLESMVPSKQATSFLIAELTRLTGGMRLDSIRQKVDEGTEYSRIFVELKFDASYGEVVNYLKKVETISPFLKIEELEIIEPRKRKKANEGTTAKLVMASLLGNQPFSEGLKAKDVKAVQIRDIFASTARPVMVEAEIEIDLKLEGITYAAVPTGIINGEVVKEGDKVSGLTVKKILPEAIVLGDGIEEYVLKVERD
ncbi:MAG: type 4a pilus biogenesis protein PilO [Candidatus Omnitrophota bacterium]